MMGGLLEDLRDGGRGKLVTGIPHSMELAIFCNISWTLGSDKLVPLGHA